MLGIEIVDLLKEKGYDIDNADGDDLHDLQSQFEDDMEEYLEEYIKDNAGTICFEYAGRLGIEKKPSPKSNKVKEKK